VGVFLCIICVPLFFPSLRGEGNLPFWDHRYKYIIQALRNAPSAMGRRGCTVPDLSLLERCRTGLRRTAHCFLRPLVQTGAGKPVFLLRFPPPVLPLPRVGCLASLLPLGRGKLYSHPSPSIPRKRSISLESETVFFFPPGTPLKELASWSYPSTGPVRLTPKLLFLTLGPGMSLCSPQKGGTNCRPGFVWTSLPQPHGAHTGSMLIFPSAG